jgi:curved DNA-binding protein CbpA
MDHAADLYRLLQVDPAADDFVIQAAYRALARRHHPDGNSPDPKRMAELNAAHAVLRDPERRRAYDVRRSLARSQAVAIVDGPKRVDAWVPRTSREGGAVMLDFGRYAGWTIADLVRHDPDYLRWLCRHSSGLRFREAIVRVLPPEPGLERRANSVA